MMQILDCEQGSPEWHLARLGIPTASEYATVLRQRGKGEDGTSKERRTYLLRLAGERITGEPAETYSNHHFERGKAMESAARNQYAFQHGGELQRVGFIRSGDTGCSPDALIGKNGVLEIKTALPHILIDRLLRGGVPPEHHAQLQGVMWIAEREWCDLAIFWPRLPLYVIRVYRDDQYIKRLADAVALFNTELQQTVDYVHRYGVEEAA